jgi:phospholipase D1/2
MKGKEGLVQKRTGSTQRGGMGCNFCGLLDNYVCVRYSSDALALVQIV